MILSVQASEQDTIQLKTGNFGKAPEITYMDAKGGMQTLDPSKGKLTALHFWATWCVPCIDELPQVDDAQDIFGKNLQIVPLAMDRKNVEKVQQFFKTHRIEHLPILLDPSNRMAKTAGFSNLPATLFIDAKGNVVAKADGPLDWQREDVAGFIKSRLK